MEIIIGMIKMRIQDYFECFNCLPIYLRNHVFKKLFRIVIRAPNSLDPNQVPYFVGPGLGLKYLQAEDITIRAKCYNFN